MTDEIYAKTWRRLDLDLAMYGGDENVSFIILDHEYAGTGAPDDDNMITYSGFSPDGNLFAINEIIAQKVSLYVIHEPNWTGWMEYRSDFYVYWTKNDWTEWTGSEWNDNQCILVHMEYDWTYKETEDYSPFLSDLYNDVVDYRQFLTFTGRQIEPYVDSRVEVYKDGDLAFSTPVLNETNDYSFTYNVYLPVDIPYEGTDKNIELRISEIDGENTVSKNVTMTSTCYRYVIYYMNKVGGWNWFFVNGKELKTDKMARTYYKRNYYPQHQNDLNKTPYVNNITESWEFTTGWLEESQARWVIDLLESNRVYIQDLNAGDNIQKSVNVTNSSVEYKTYKNQGRKLYAYTINVEASQPRYVADSIRTLEYYE